MGKRRNQFDGRPVGGGAPSAAAAARAAPLARGGKRGKARGADGAPPPPRPWWAGLLAGAAALAAAAYAALQAAAAAERDRSILAGMRSRPLSWSDHAACRAECRFVTRAHVEAALSRGQLNAAKSDPRQRPCPKYVVDSDAGGGKRLQTVFAACAAQTRVVTVIDRSTDWPCSPC
jgi:hypothetical protein